MRSSEEVEIEQGKKSKKLNIKNARKSFNPKNRSIRKILLA